MEQLRAASRPSEPSSFRVISKSEERNSVALIPLGCRIVGTVELCGQVQIDGEIDGDLASTGEIIIGESAIINANIATNRIRVFGQVNGDIIAHEKLEFLAGACVKGNISSPVVSMQDGVVFIGRCIMPTPDRPIRENIIVMKNEASSDLLPNESPKLEPQRQEKQETFWTFNQ